LRRLSPRHERGPTVGNLISFGFIGEDHRRRDSPLHPKLAAERTNAAMRALHTMPPTMHSSEPGGSVAVAIVASSAPVLSLGRRPLHTLRIHDTSEKRTHYNTTMKRIASAVLLLLVCTFCGCHTPHTNTGWEYKQVYAHLSDQQLNDYAKQGWLVDQLVKGRSDQGNEWVYILLKRRVH
jgi:hypothetical protein